ncbi:PAS domain-containing protein [Litoribacter ruber]|uniref:PAS domain-containing protein n=1 Tax=Litoribacter ruber TaxID=702568 RepID=UPI001BDB27DC|nr:PAS domain-containing protein [Litoribacter ruber]MBT0811801.1 PAS domain-containing protein [Litoribacter ruber]
MENRGIHSTFKKIIDASSDLIFMADGETPFTIFYVNAAFKEAVGYNLEKESLLGLGVDITSFENNDRVTFQLNERLFSFEFERNKGLGENYLLFHKGKKISSSPEPINASPLPLFENSLDIFGIGEGTSFHWVSNSITNLLGYLPSEFANTSLILFVHPQDREPFRTALQEVKLQNGATSFSFRFKSKSGAYKWLQWNVSYKQDKLHAVGRDIDNLKSQQLALDSQNQLFKMGELAAKFGVWEVDLLTYRTFWSQEIYDIYDFPTGNRYDIFEWIQLCVPECRTKLKAAFGELLESGKSFETKVQISTQDNNFKWVKIIGKGETENGVLKKAFGTLQDITQEEEVMVNLGLFKEIFNLTPDAVQVAELDGNIIFQNEEAKERILKEGEEKSPMNLRVLEPAFRKPGSWEKHLENLRKQKSLLSLSEHHIIGKESVPVELNTKLVKLGGKEYVLAMSRDISDRIMLEASLKESHQFLQRVTDQMPGVLYQLVCGEDGKLQFPYISSGINRIFGISEEEFDQHGGFEAVLNRIHPKDVEEFVEGILQSAQSFKPWHGQFRILSENGENYKWVQASSIPEKLSNGEITWYGYFTDITEIKQTESKLEQAKSAAEQASKTKSEFLSMISHEIRTPLNAISGSVYSLLQENLPNGLESSLKTINFATENLITIINDLLDFQKIEFGKIKLESAPIKIQNLVEMVVNGLSFHATDTGNELNMSFIGNMDFEVMGDKVRIGQILNNLLTNALKFTKKGQVDVNVGFAGFRDGRADFNFEVVDTGVGIPQEFHSKIFDDFEQVSSSFSRKYGGTGLGLSITKKLLDKMGSQIHLDSKVGEGSRFYFMLSLPLANNHETKKDSEMDQSAEFNPNIPSQKLEILVAEDNEVNALVLGKIIKKWGYQFDRVSNGLEAVDAVGKKHYDIVLMDIQMPVMNGFLATETIKSISSVPVIALTAANRTEIQDQIAMNGFDGFVSKPINAKALLTEIKHLIRVN